jgi:hypothetical protein
MTRSVRLYTAAQFEEVNTLVDLMAERSDLPPAERDRLTAFQPGSAASCYDGSGPRVLAETREVPCLRAVPAPPHGDDPSLS